MALNDNVEIIRKVFEKNLKDKIPEYIRNDERWTKIIEQSWIFLTRLEILNQKLELNLFNGISLGENQKYNSVYWIVDNIKNAFAKNREIRKRLEIIQDDFEQSLMKFYGGNFAWAYIDSKTNKIIFVGGDSYKKLVEENFQWNKNSGTKSSFSTKGFNIDSLKDINQKQAQQVKELNEIIQRRHASYKRILDLSFKRLKKDMDYKREWPRFKNTFYFHLEDYDTQIGWSKPISNKGWISEGYVAALLGNAFEGKGEEKQVETLAYPYVEETDNKAAAFGEDIFFDYNGMKFQIAVKSGKFSTASLTPFLQMATYLTGIQEQDIKNFSIEELNKKEVQDSIIRGSINYLKNSLKYIREVILVELNKNSV